MKRMPGGSRAIYVALMAELGHGRRRFINRFLSPALCSSLVPQAANSGWRAGGSPAGLASPLASRGGSALYKENEMEKGQMFWPKCQRSRGRTNRCSPAPGKAGLSCTRCSHRAGGRHPPSGAASCVSRSRPWISHDVLMTCEKNCRIHPPRPPSPETSRDQATLNTVPCRTKVNVHRRPV